LNRKRKSFYCSKNFSAVSENKVVKIEKLFFKLT
jgi:hypothetical protein